MGDASAGDARMRAAFETQAGWCAQLGSPFTASVLRAAVAGDWDGPIAHLVDGWVGDPVADMVALRVAGALHALVLSGTDVALADLYPPGPIPDAAALRSAVRDACARHRDFLARFIAAPPQTNEVARSGALLGGFLDIAAATGLPMRLLEIGASGGLNLLWDRFFYRLGAGAWGDAASPVQLAPSWRGGLPKLDAPVRVAGRTGCDLAPVDVLDETNCLRLRSFVWADQADRLARLEGAIAIARLAGVAVARSNATDFLARELAAARDGEVTVVYHSIMWHYVSVADQQALTETIMRAAARATDAAPLAWLRFEIEDFGQQPVVRLTLWPGGESRRLAVAHPHGAWVEWLG
jgi:hypothetical protein